LSNLYEIGKYGLGNRGKSTNYQQNRNFHIVSIDAASAAAGNITIYIGKYFSLFARNI